MEKGGVQKPKKRPAKLNLAIAQQYQQEQQQNNFNGNYLNVL